VTAEKRRTCIRIRHLLETFFLAATDQYILRPYSVYFKTPAQTFRFLVRSYLLLKHFTNYSLNVRFAYLIAVRSTDSNIRIQVVWNERSEMTPRHRQA